MPLFDRFKIKVEQEKAPVPPSAQEVASRAYALNTFIVFGKMLGGSGVLPNQLRSMPDETAKPIEEAAAKISRQIAGAAQKFGFLKSFSPTEAFVIATPFRKLEDEMVVNATWRAESLQAILWALGEIKSLPNYDKQAGDEILKVLRLEKILEFVTAARLRNAGDLEKARELAELWHWRSRTRQLIDEKRPFPEMPQFKSYDEIVRFTAKKTKENGDFAEIIDEDFAVNGKAYRDLTNAEWSEVQSITVERHFALNWICGRSPGNQWDATPTGT